MNGLDDFHTDTYGGEDHKNFLRSWSDKYLSNLGRLRTSANSVSVASDTSSSPLCNPHLRAFPEGHELDPIHREHKLIGNFIGRRECHLESEWLLIYKLEEDRVTFERMGTHSGLS